MPQRTHPRIAIIAGISVDAATRAAVAAGKRPRIDVLEMERRFPAQVFDFSYLQQAARSSRRTAALLRFAQRTGRWSLALAYAIAKMVREYDVVYATGEDVGFALAMCMRLRHIDRPRLVVRLEEPNQGRTILRQTAFGVYRHYALNRIDRIVCRTSAHQQFLQSALRVPAERTKLVPEPVDHQFFTPELALEATGMAPVPSGEFVLSAGLEMRDYGTLIEAARALPVQVVIAAGSPWSHFRFHDPSQRDLPENIYVSRFTPEEMRTLYQLSSLVAVPVMPTLRACGMNVVLEAWSMQKAVIVTRTAGMTDYVYHDQTGLLVEPRDIEAMRKSIVSLLDQRQKRTILGDNGRKSVNERFNLDIYVDRIYKIITEAVPS